MHSFDAVYDSMLGLLLEEYAVADVENAFAEGSICAKEYERMRDAYERLCDRLHIQNEDPDLDIMVDAMENIQRELCRRMYGYASRLL